MADVYDATGEVGTLTGAGTPFKVYADSVSIANADTLTIPGATAIVSVTSNPASSTAVAGISGNQITWTMGATVVVQVLVIYY
jgi:hypothetical protein